MIFESGADFLAEPNKRITLMGMSNVGKTTMATMLPRNRWFHYSIDYRLATAYLLEPMIDVVKKHMMKDSYLAKHLRDDALSVQMNVTFNNLTMVSNYLGKMGCSSLGGLSISDFCQRQARHRMAEIEAVNDIDNFIHKAKDIYNYDHFIADASGSICEIIDPWDDDDRVLSAVTASTILIYIRAGLEHERWLIENSSRHPKPLYYRPEFLRKAISDYLLETGLRGSEEIDPDSFVKWAFVRLLEARRPRYERIAQHGYIIESI